MSTVLITGAGGMVGSHMLDYFTSKDTTVVGTYYKPTVPFDEIEGKGTLLECDIRYFTTVYDIVRSYLPDTIYHLAAQSYPSVSWDKPQETFEVNVIGTVNLFEAIRRVRESIPDYNPAVVVACSSAEYGGALNDCPGAAKEELSLLPLHPYGISKVGQDLLAYQYHVNFQIQAIRARIFNTTGPRKTNDVCSDFTKRIVQLEHSGGHNLQVGNLSTRRAIMDVRDLINALVLLAEKGTPGEVYNICGHTIYSVSEIVDLIRQFAKIDFSVEVNESLLRPTDEKVICGDATKLIEATGWKQRYPLNQTIQDMMTYWRRKL